MSARHTDAVVKAILDVSEVNTVAMKLSRLV